MQVSLLIFTFINILILQAEVSLAHLKETALHLQRVIISYLSLLFLYYQSFHLNEDQHVGLV